MRDPIEIWNDLLHDAAEQGAADCERTDDDMRWAHEVQARVTAWLTRRGHQGTSPSALVQRGLKIPPEIQVMGRGVLVAQLERLRAIGNLQYAHQDLTGLTDHDLQTILAAALQPFER
jgi:hypothetical protein